MTCDQFQDLILEYCEGAVSADDRKRVESHVAICGECRAFLAGQQELDARLARAIVAPQLSAGFKRRVLAETKFRPEGLRFGDFVEVLDWIAYSGLALAAIYLLQQFPDASTDIFWIAATGSLVYGLWEGSKLLRDSVL
jgi:Putative zinc-finger